jgi:hypothetical protein
MTALEEVERVFPGSRLVRTTHKENPTMTDAPPDAEKIVVVEALRQAYKLVAAQVALVEQYGAHRYLTSALEHIKAAAELVKS